MGTKIEWADEVWNPVTGCSKVSPGCAHCYAERLATTRLVGKPGYTGLPWTPENAAVNVVLRPDRLDQPLRWRKPSRVFVNSMSDLFHELVPYQYLDRVFLTMALASHHRFLVLTKRPERMRGYLSDPATLGRLMLRLAEAARMTGMEMRSEFADDGLDGVRLRNVWLGTSVENQHWADVRLPPLLDTPAAVRFLSVEPLLGPIEFSDATNAPDLRERLGRPALEGIDWIIVGGESGPGRREMDPAWLASIAAQADAAGVALFVKQDSGPRSGLRGRIPDALWARKEYPRA